jgi:hypothetical protein
MPCNQLVVTNAAKYVTRVMLNDPNNKTGLCAKGERTVAINVDSTHTLKIWRGT